MLTDGDISKDVIYLEGYHEGALDMADFLISEIDVEYLDDRIVSFLEDKMVEWLESNLFTDD